MRPYSTPSVFSLLTTAKAKSFYPSFLSEYHRLSFFAREMERKFRFFTHRPLSPICTHPAPETRIRDIKSHIPKAMRYYGDRWEVKFSLKSID